MHRRAIAPRALGSTTKTRALIRGQVLAAPIGEATSPRVLKALKGSARSAVAFESPTLRNALILWQVGTVIVREAARTSYRRLRAIIMTKTSPDGGAEVMDWIHDRRVAVIRELCPSAGRAEKVGRKPARER